LSLFLARRVDQRRFERFLGPLVAPQHELERRIEPVAFGDLRFSTANCAIDRLSIPSAPSISPCR
jgi:hypothetical protein